MDNIKNEFFKALQEYLKEETKQQYEDYWTNYSPNIGNGLLDALLKADKIRIKNEMNNEQKRVRIIYIEHTTEEAREQIVNVIGEMFEGTNEKPLIIFTDNVELIQQNEILDRLYRIEELLENKNKNMNE